MSLSPRLMGALIGPLCLAACASLPLAAPSADAPRGQDFRSRSAAVLTDACALQQDGDSATVYRRVSVSLAGSAAVAMASRLKQEGYSVRGTHSPAACAALGRDLGEALIADERDQIGAPGFLPIPHSAEALADDTLAPAVSAFLRAALAEAPQSALEALPVATLDRVRSLVGADYLWVAVLTARDDAGGGVLGQMLRGNPPYARDGAAVAFVDLAGREVVWQDHKRWAQTDGGPAESAWAGKLLSPFVAPLEIALEAAVPVENPNFAPVAAPSAIAQATIPVALDSGALPPPGPAVAPRARTPKPTVAPPPPQAPFPELVRERPTADAAVADDRSVAEAPVGQALREVVDFRTSPTNNSTVIRQLPKGLRVVVESTFQNRFGKWLFVSIGNERGWIQARGVEREDASW